MSKLQRVKRNFIRFLLLCLRPETLLYAVREYKTPKRLHENENCVFPGYMVNKGQAITDITASSVSVRIDWIFASSAEWIKRAIS